MPSSHSISIEQEDIGPAQDFHDLLKPLSPEQCKNVCAEMKEDISQIINNVDDFLMVIDGLSPEQANVVCAAMSEILPQLINHADDFLNVFLWLSPEQLKIENCVILKECLLNMLDDIKDFQNVFPILSPRQCTSVCMIVNESRPQLIRNTEDFKVMFEPLPDDNGQRIAVCQGMQQKLSQVIQIDELLQYFPDDTEKEEVLRIFFASLLQEIKIQSLQFTGWGNLKARKAVETLYSALEDASTTYFNKDSTKKNYDDFERSCMTAIDEARQDLNNYHSWKDLFSTLALTIVSFGIIPAALSVNNKLQTGNWAFHLFKTPVETKFNDVAEVVHQLGNGKSKQMSGY